MAILHLADLPRDLRESVERELAQLDQDGELDLSESETDIPLID